ncbi:unnamed protein product [marine sediment metagenome]|uniref:Uncharacterized protein n=1 Tax=marine sediment metagenome TaxID=412755 RepID=X0YTC5_9ZZZZ
MAIPIHAKQLIDKLIEAGIIPGNCTRAIIDIGISDAAKIYYEVYGDSRLLDVDWGSIGPVIKGTAKKQTRINKISCINSDVEYYVEVPC